MQAAAGGPDQAGEMQFLTGHGGNSICAQRGGLESGLSEEDKAKLKKDCSSIEAVSVRVVPFGQLLLDQGITHVWLCLFVCLRAWRACVLQLLVAWLGTCHSTLEGIHTYQQNTG